MRIATWNVNSVRARHERLLRWLQTHQPDLLCLQELKCQEAQFPFEALRELGYEAAVHGQKTYNGVAILSRQPADEVWAGMMDDEDDPQARLLTCRFGELHVVSAYFPNGSSVDSPKFAYKLRWMQRLRRWLDLRFRPDQAILLCGDFNVAPEDRDVAKVENWADTVLCVPAVREALASIYDFGFTDLVRTHRPEEGLYSWWDYRQLAFPRNEGLRIDHIVGTASLMPRCSGAWIDRDERKGASPSDHAPVVVELDAFEAEG